MVHHFKYARIIKNTFNEPMYISILSKEVLKRSSCLEGIKTSLKLITIYDTVISSEAGDKVFEPGIFLFREVSRFFLWSF